MSVKKCLLFVRKHKVVYNSFRHFVQLYDTYTRIVPSSRDIYCFPRKYQMLVLLCFRKLYNKILKHFQLIRFNVLFCRYKRNFKNPFNISVSFHIKTQPHKVTSNELPPPFLCFPLKSRFFQQPKTTNSPQFIYVHNPKSVFPFFRLDEHRGIINNP